MKIVPYVRLNRGVVQNLRARMIDSTYTVGSDPNSMRDQGTTRNVEYTFNDNSMNTIDV